jgi:hypothetical protein
MLPLDHVESYANVMKQGHGAIVSGGRKLMHPTAAVVISKTWG